MIVEIVARDTLRVVDLGQRGLYLAGGQAFADSEMASSCRASYGRIGEGRVAVDGRRRPAPRRRAPRR